MSQNLVPLTLSVAVAGALLGLSNPTIYRLAKSGGLPMAPLGGRKRVVTAELERMFGQPITTERIAEAMARTRYPTRLE